MQTRFGLACSTVVHVAAARTVPRVFCGVYMNSQKVKVAVVWIGLLLLIPVYHRNRRRAFDVGTRGLVCSSRRGSGGESSQQPVELVAKNISVECWSYRNSTFHPTGRCRLRNRTASRTDSDSCRRRWLSGNLEHVSHARFLRYRHEQSNRPHQRKQRPPTAKQFTSP